MEPTNGRQDYRGQGRRIAGPATGKFTMKKVLSPDAQIRRRGGIRPVRRLSASLTAYFGDETVAWN